MYSLFLLDIPLAVEGLCTYLFYICCLVVALKKKHPNIRHSTYHLIHFYIKIGLKYIHKHTHHMLSHSASLMRKLKKFIIAGLSTMPLYGSLYSKLCCIPYSELLSSQNLNAVNNSIMSYSIQKAINISNQQYFLKVASFSKCTLKHIMQQSNVVTCGVSWPFLL